MIPSKQLILNSPLNDCQRKYHKMILRLWIGVQKTAKTDVKNDDTPFVICLIFLLGPRNRNGRSGVYFSAPQQQFSCCLTPLHFNTQQKLNQTSETKRYHVTAVFNVFILLLNNIPVIVGISFGPGWELFTFLVDQSIPTSSSCTHTEASFSGRLSLGRVQALWRNGWPFDRRTSRLSFSLRPYNPI